MPGIFVHQMAAICSLGNGLEPVRRNLLHATGNFLSPTHWPGLPPLLVGEVKQPLPTLEQFQPAYRGRNNALLALAHEQIKHQLAELKQQIGADRMAIVLGTSTSGIGESERAYAQFLRTGVWPEEFAYSQQEMYAPARFLQLLSGIAGPSYVISTACSSSARAIIAGARLLRTGAVDAVIVGGVDSLCRFTLAGFHALEALDPAVCKPFSANRAGINIGEAAALLVLRREASDIELAGYGESADAHHMSAPEPEGKQPRLAIESALKRAGITGADVDYVNLHGTGTPQNDAMEAKLSLAYGSTTRYSSTKALSGHTLGAAGAIEAIFSCLVLRDNPQQLLPIHHYDGVPDSTLIPIHLVDAQHQAADRLRVVASHSFAFGGSNAVLIFRRNSL